MRCPLSDMVFMATGCQCGNENGGGAMESATENDKELEPLLFGGPAVSMLGSTLDVFHDPKDQRGKAESRRGGKYNTPNRDTPCR